MNKDNLKTILRPLIKECIKEVIFEEGILSGIVSEVLTGAQSASAQPLIERAPQPVAKQPPPEQQHAQYEQDRRRKLQETRHKMAKAIGESAYNGVDIFEGTQPISKAGQPGNDAHPAGALSGVDPGDPGVDLGAFFGASQNWSKLV